MRRSWPFLITASLTLSLVVPLVYGGFGSLAGLHRVPVWALAMLLSCVLLSWNFNAARMRLLARGLGVRLGLVSSLIAVISCEFAWVATPASAGGPATYVLLLTRHGLKPGRGAAMVVVDQFMDLVFFATTVPMALLLYTMHNSLENPVRLGLLAVLLPLAGMGVLVWLLSRYRPVVLAAGRILRRIPALDRFRFRMARGLVCFKQSVLRLLAVGKGKLFLLYFFCLGHWVLRYGILPVLLWVMGESVPWGYLFASQGLLLFLGHATVLPGGGGGVEIGFSALLRPYLDPATSAVALLVWRFCTFHFYLLVGGPIFLVATGKMAKRLLGADSSGPEGTFREGRSGGCGLRGDAAGDPTPNAR